MSKNSERDSRTRIVPRVMGQSRGRGISREDIVMLRERAEVLNERIDQISKMIGALEQGKNAKGVGIGGTIKGSGRSGTRSRSSVRVRDANIDGRMRPVKSAPARNYPATPRGISDQNRARVQPVLKAVVDTRKCTGCGACEEYCPEGAIRIRRGVARVNREACVGCANCIPLCPVQAISLG
jgi:Pyruvate/2-oxoacid:ferredoxin oxidoreductase delta subunit